MTTYESIKVILWLAFLDTIQVAIVYVAKSAGDDQKAYNTFATIVATARDAYTRIKTLADIDAAIPPHTHPQT